jgi:GAF domain-containing protein
MHAEEARLSALHGLAALDTAFEPALDELVRFAGERFAVPIALVSLVDEDRQWFKARLGLDVCETAREHAFCDHAIRADAVMVVPDARLDPRFRDNPFVTGPPFIRFYAGAPLVHLGERVGTCCLIDTAPRAFSRADREDLETLAGAVVAELEISRAKRFQRLPA